MSGQPPGADLGRVVVLHPGAMGGAVAAQFAAAGATVGWVAEGRSEATRERAQAAGLAELATLEEAVAWADTVLSICPPHGAEALAREVAALGFDRCYAELNAIAPARLEGIVAAFAPTGATVLDGCLIGPPPRERTAVRLYLAGDPAIVAGFETLLAGTLVDARGLGGEPGTAKGLKVAFAIHNKGSLALAALAQSLADAHGVLEALDREWEGRPGGSPAERLGSSAAAAWRWSGEMEEIAEACREVGLDPGLPEAVGGLYERWVSYRDRAETPRERLLGDLRDRH